VYVADATAAGPGRAKTLVLELVSAAVREVGSLLASDVKFRLSEARKDSGAACDIAQLAWEGLSAFADRIVEGNSLWITPSAEADDSLP